MLRRTMPTAFWAVHLSCGQRGTMNTESLRSETDYGCLVDALRVPYGDLSPASAQSPKTSMMLIMLISLTRSETDAIAANFHAMVLVLAIRPSCPELVP